MVGGTFVILRGSGIGFINIVTEPSEVSTSKVPLLIGNSTDSDIYILDITHILLVN